MEKYLLIITERSSFEQLLRLALDEIPPERIQFATSREEALQIAEDHPIELVLLDAESIDDASGLARSILKDRPECKLILAPPHNNPQDPAIRELIPDRYLSQPFMKEDLLMMIQDLTGEPIFADSNEKPLPTAENGSSLLDDLKQQLALQPDDFPVIGDEDMISLGEELEQLLSDSSESEKTELSQEDAFQLTESLQEEPDRETSEEEEIPTELDETTIDRLFSDEHELSSLHEPSEDDEVLRSVMEQLEEQTTPITVPESKDFLTEDLDAELEILITETIAENGPDFDEHQEEIGENETDQIPQELMEALHEKESESLETVELQETSQTDEPVEISDRIEPSLTEEDLLEDIRIALIENDPSSVCRMLALLKNELDVHALMIFSLGKIWCVAGQLSDKDKEAIAVVLGQSGKSDRNIDFASFIKLGEPQEKYLLYAATITGTLAISTINTPSVPLSQIRSQTLSIAQRLFVEEQDLPQTLTLPQEPEESGYTEPASDILSEADEAPATTLDELFAEEMTRVEEPQPEKDEWVHEIPDGEIETDLIEAADQSGEESVPADDGTQTSDAMQITQEEDSVLDIGVSVDLPDAEPLREAYDEAAFAITDKGTEADSTSRLEMSAVQIPVEAGISEERLEPDGVSVEAEAPVTQETEVSDMSQPNENLPEPVNVSRGYPKAGYGRFKNRKPSWDKAKQQRIEKEVEQGITFHIQKQAGEVDDIAIKVRVQEFLAHTVLAAEGKWEPGYNDPLSHIRKKLKNQKQYPPNKLWPEADTSIEKIVYKKPFKQDIRQPAKYVQKLTDGSTAVDTMSEVSGDQTSQPIIKDQEPKDWLAPPETLKGVLAEARLAEAHQPETLPPDYQDELDGILSDILKTSDDQEDSASSAAKPGEKEVVGEEPELPIGLGIPESLDEVIILDENLDFLTDMAEGMQFDDVDVDEDADTFFEEYVKRAGERIEEETNEITDALDEELLGIEAEETQRIETAATHTISEKEVIDQVEQPAVEEESISEERTDYAEMMGRLREKLGAKTEPESEPEETVDITDDSSPMTVTLQESRHADDLPSQKVKSEREGPGTWPHDHEEEIEWEEFPTSLQAFEPDEISVEMQETDQKDRLTEDSGAPDDEATEEEVEEFPEFEDFDETEEIAEKEVEAVETEMELRQIIAEVLAEPEDQALEEAQREESLDSSFQTADEPPVEEMDQADMDTITQERQDDAILDDDLLPWEKEQDAAPADIEVTPVPRSLLGEDQSADVLVDLLADTRLDPVSLSFDQPLYTCILVPELTDFSLNTRIATRMKEWLPRLSRVFGWQFENILVQPTYLQWTVRVPSGTSQGSIVRKVRQQTSLRIFEEFPELKKLSQSGNFWAKGYLVVSGPNPPPAEFLDDFIQKNRRPKGIFGS